MTLFMHVQVTQDFLEYIHRKQKGDSPEPESPSLGEKEEGVPYISAEELVSDHSIIGSVACTSIGSEILCT